MIDSRLLQDNRCNNIESVNLIIIPTDPNVRYGPRGDDFNSEFIGRANGGLGHCFKFPRKPKFLNGSINDCINHMPGEEELKNLKNGDFSGVNVGSSPSKNRMQHSNPRINRPRNEQMGYEENKNGGELIDFSNAFTKGGGRNNKPMLGERPRLNGRPALGSRTIVDRTKITKSNTSRPKTGTPMVKMTKAMEMRRRANIDKQNKFDRSSTRPLETIRERSNEESFGKPSHRRSPLQRSLQKPWMRNNRDETSMD